MGYKSIKKIDKIWQISTNNIFVLKIITKSGIYNIYMVKNHTIVEFGLKIGSNVEHAFFGG